MPTNKATMNKTFEQFLKDKYDNNYSSVPTYKEWRLLLDVIELADYKIEYSASLLPINPAQARQKLDCLTRYRELLEKAKAVLVNLSEHDILSGNEIQLIHDINEALKEESERL